MPNQLRQKDMPSKLARKNKKEVGSLTLKYRDEMPLKMSISDTKIEIFFYR
jgi:hypothetical protein